ncbi:hypothetical protein GCM10011571_31200 [Marinithermofilum abyssi]|uniref:Uncharacterized protein n=1 Tax=Marinithermofilum abyssi TaxID=1571185 RepID=A0A8J2VDS2_9BACL|nr:hypothetical protein [Marinithermofilum abyssi]GGE26741.1 hypothetical protein GCM10011571_31200 [Marinithermofilum abyssi]
MMDVIHISLRTWQVRLLKGIAAIQAAAAIVIGGHVWNYPVSFMDRMVYTTEREGAWMTGAFSITATIGLCVALFFLLRALPSRYRPFLQLAWMVGVIGGAAAVIHDLLRMIWMPLMASWLLEMPSVSLADYAGSWELLLTRMGGVFIPVCYVIGGLMYGAVMLRNSLLPSSFSCGYIAVWAGVLSMSLWMGTSPHRVLWIHAGTFFLISVWLWKAATILHRREAGKITRRYPLASENGSGPSNKGFFSNA